MTLRHRPEGRGHPYERDPDQRVPYRPVAGERLELRVTTPTEVKTVDLELGDGRRLAAVCRGEAAPDEDPRFGQKRHGAEPGHLSDASSYQGEGRRAWAAVVDDLRAGEVLRYRFSAGNETTPWFECVVCEWQAAVAIELEGPAERVGSRQEVLTDGAHRFRARFSLRLRPEQHVVGFGERFDALDQRGRCVDTQVYDQYKGQGARSYLPAPFAIVFGNDCFGFHLDTGRRCFFDVGASSPGRLVVEVDLEPDSAGDERVRVELFTGSPAEIVEAFSRRTSPQLAAPPDWIYRLWLSGNEWSSDTRVRAEIAAAADTGIPVGALVLEAWSDEQTFVAFNGAEYEPHPDGAPHRLADFRFHADGPWPNPKQLIDDLHADDIKVLLWQIPLVGSAEGQAGLDQAVMIERGYCVRNADGTPYRNPGGWFNSALMLDFTSSEAADWWLAKRRYLVDEIGVDGFKTDGGEHAWGSDLRYADGTTGGETNNRYPVLYQAAYHRLMHERGRTGVTFSRAGFTGSGAFPCHWAGDEDSSWEAFRASITAGLTAAVSGVFWWGWDIAGFSGPLPTPELYLRATAMATLAPIMQLHSEFNHHRSPSRDRTPWNVAEQSGDARVLPLFRRFAELRERLLPYLAEAGAQAATNRIPVMRPLCLDFPDEDAVWEFPLQYLLGNGLLVAPVDRPNRTEWQVYLPGGEWCELGRDSNEIVTGQRVVTVPAPISSVPVFCRAERAAELAPLFAPLHSDELLEVS